MCWHFDIAWVIFNFKFAVPNVPKRCWTYRAMGCVFTVAIPLPTSCELFFGPILRGMLRWAVQELRGTNTQTDIGNDRFRDLHYGVRQMLNLTLFLWEGAIEVDDVTPRANRMSHREWTERRSCVSAARNWLYSYYSISRLPASVSSSLDYIGLARACSSSVTYDRR